MSKNPHFQVFTKKMGGRWPPRAQVSIRSNGQIMLSPMAMMALREPDQVALYWSHETGEAGMKATTKDDPNAYVFRKVGGNAKGIFAKGFLKYFGVLPEKASRYDCRYDDGMLIFKMRGAP